MVRIASDTDVFHALADPTRRQMLHLLAERDRPVMDLVGSFNMSQPSISEHLRILRRVGLVRTTPAGRQRIYSLEPMPLKEVADWVAFFNHFWDEKLQALGRYLSRTRRVNTGISLEID